MRYPIVIHKDLESAYGVTVPDLPGCFSAGDTLEEAVEHAQEAVECHLEGIVEDSEAIPEPKPIEEHRANPDFANGVWVLIEVDLAKLDDKAERVNITVPRRVLTLIDEHAKARHESRSGFLARAALAEIRREVGAR